MFCAQCGNEIPATSKFCFRCGSAVPDLVPTVPSSGGVGAATVPCEQRQNEGRDEAVADVVPPPVPRAVIRNVVSKPARKRRLLLAAIGLSLGVVLVSIMWSRLTDTPERRLKVLATWRTAPPRSLLEAVQYFQTHRDSRAIPPLLEIVGSRTFINSAAAANALTFTADSTAVSGLCMELQRHPGTNDSTERLIQGYLAEALEHVGDKRAIDPLIRLVEGATGKSKDVELDKRVIKAAASFHDSRIVNPLLAFVKDYNGIDLSDDLKKIAVTGVGSFGEAQFPALLDTLNYTVAHSKFQQVPSFFSLGFSQMGETAERQAVEWLHKRNYEKLGFATIVRTKNPRLLDELRQYALRASGYDSDDEALAESYNDALAEMLISALSLKSKAGLDSYRSVDDVHKTAARWLGAMGKPVIPKLAALLSNADNDVRLHAASSLAGMTELVKSGPRVLEYEHRPLQDVQAVLDNPNVSKDIYVVAGGHEYYLWYLKQGSGKQDNRMNEIKSLLVDALEDNIGGRDLASDVLKSSDPTLSEAVRKWAKRNGYTIRTCSGPTSFGCF